jgi:hypothetical protein
MRYRVTIEREGHPKREVFYDEPIEAWRFLQFRIAMGCIRAELVELSDDGSESLHRYAHSAERE